MALTKRNTGAAFDLSSQLTTIQETIKESVPGTEVPSPASMESVGLNQTRTINQVPHTNRQISSEYGQIVTKPAAKKVNDNSVMVGFKIPKEAKEQYREFFEAYGLNLSEAVKNALEYFAADVKNGKVRITLTRHFERVEEE